MAISKKSNDKSCHIYHNIDVEPTDIYKHTHLNNKRMKYLSKFDYNEARFTSEMNCNHSSTV